MRVPTRGFADSSQVLATLQRTDLTANATGWGFSSPAGFRVTLPADACPGSLTVIPLATPHP
jgi:hypothetical protein